MRACKGRYPKALQAHSGNSGSLAALLDALFQLLLFVPDEPGPPRNLSAVTLRPVGDKYQVLSNNAQAFVDAAAGARVYKGYVDTHDLPIELRELVDMIEDPLAARERNKHQKVTVYQMGTHVVVESPHIHVPVTVLGGATQRGELELVGVVPSPTEGLACIVYQGRLKAEDVLFRIRSFCSEGMLYRSILDEAYLTSKLAPELRRCMAGELTQTIELGDMLEEVGSHEWDAHFSSFVDRRHVRLWRYDELSKFVRVGPVVSKMWRPHQPPSQTPSEPKLWTVVDGETAHSLYAAIESDNPGAFCQQVNSLFTDRLVEPHGTAGDDIYIYKVTQFQPGEPRPRLLAANALIVADIQEALEEAFNKRNLYRPNIGLFNCVYENRVWDRLLGAPPEVPRITRQDVQVSGSTIKATWLSLLTPMSCVSHIRLLTALRELLLKLGGMPFCRMNGADCVGYRFVDVEYEPRYCAPRLNGHFTLVFECQGASREPIHKFEVVNVFRNWTNEELADPELWTSKPPGVLLWDSINVMRTAGGPDPLDTMKQTRFLLESVAARRDHSSIWNILVGGHDKHSWVTVTDQVGDVGRAITRIAQWSHASGQRITMQVVEGKVKVNLQACDIRSLTAFLEEHCGPYDVSDAPCIASLLLSWFVTSTGVQYGVHARHTPRTRLA